MRRSGRCTVTLPGRNGGVKDEEGEETRVVCLRESDGSLHLPLSSRRTNYKVMDSRLISRATTGVKLAGSWCHAWCDGEEGRQRGGGHESRGTMRRCRGRGGCRVETMYHRICFLPCVYLSPLILYTFHTEILSAVSVFCFVSAVSVSISVLPRPLSLLSHFSFLPLSLSFIPPRRWRSVS